MNEVKEMKNITLILIAFLATSPFLSENVCIAEANHKDRHPAFESVKSVKIYLDQSYEGTAEGILKRKDVAKWFEVAGLQVVPDDASRFDSIVTIHLTGYATRRHYLPISADIYTEAKVTGEITYTLPGNYEDREKIDFHVPPSAGIESSEITKYEKPRQILHEAVYESFVEYMVKIFGRCYGDRAALNVLRLLSNDRDDDVRNKAISLLGEIRDDRAADLLIASLKDKESFVRYNAITSLGKIRDPRGVTPLIKVLLKDSSWDARGHAAEVLAEIDSEWQKDKSVKMAVPEFVTFLRNENSSVRRNAATILGKIGDSVAVKPLIRVLLKDTKWEVKYRAAIALGNIGDPRAVEPLVKALNDKDPTARDGAVMGLGKIKDRRAVEPLISTLKDPKTYVRKRAAEALGNIGDLRAVEPLIVYLSNLKESDTFEARNALRDLTKKDFRTTQEWQEWWMKEKK